VKNLAGDNDCDRYIRKELTKAHIEIVEAAKPALGEVSARLSGKLGAFTFVRAWYYWVVEGPLPLTVAEELYADPNGVEDVRVEGHCGCPPPAEWATKLAVDGRKIIADVELEKAREVLAAFPYAVADIEVGHVRESEAPKFGLFIIGYHIDTQEGLNLFTAALRKHGLVKGL